jgi:hypothetical protein
MSGTYLYDAATTNLLAGMTLDADGTITGTAVQVNWPGPVRALLTIDDPAAADDATFQVTIQGCETSDFTTSDVRTFVVSPTYTEAAANTAVAQQPFEFDFVCDSQYVRAVVVMLDGTNGDYAGSTLVLAPPHYQQGWARGDSIGYVGQSSAAPLA